MTTHPTETYFTLDPITEDVMSLGIGEVWFYFFKETLIGVRDIRNGTATFLDVSTKDDTKASMAPTIKYLTDAHVQEAIEEMSGDNEKVDRQHINELGNTAITRLMAEMNHFMNQKLLGAD